jgi:hypothetical protein
MPPKATFGDLHRLLGELGFKPKQVEGPYGLYIVFEHEATGVLHAFRAHRPDERVDPTTLAGIRMTLAENGFIEREEFASALREATSNSKVKAKRK